MNKQSGIFLHRYLEAANNTSIEVLEQHPIALELIEKCDDLIGPLVSAKQEDLGPVAHPLVLNAYFVYLAAVRTAISGHPAAVHTTLRSALEYACYAFLILEDEALAETWLKRNTDDLGRKAQRKAFNQAVSEAAKIVNKYDPETGSRITALYAAAIDFGGHPNPRSLQAHITSGGAENGDASVLGCLYPWGQETGRGLLACVEFGIALVSLLVITRTKCPPVQKFDPKLFELMAQKDNAVRHYGLIVEPGRVTYNDLD